MSYRDEITLLTKLKTFKSSAKSILTSIYNHYTIYLEHFLTNKVDRDNCKAVIIELEENKNQLIREHNQIISIVNEAINYMKLEE